MALRYLWAGPTTVLGLVVIMALVRRSHVALVDGVIEAHGPLLRGALARLTPVCGGADAITLGHVVIGRSAEALEATRAHERVHVRQYELWGPLFLPAYVIAGLYAFACGGHPYFDNRFERPAFALPPSRLAPLRRTCRRAERRIDT
jgi:hypothetical protein